MIMMCMKQKMWSLNLTTGVETSAAFITIETNQFNEMMATTSVNTGDTAVHIVLIDESIQASNS